MSHRGTTFCTFPTLQWCHRTLVPKHYTEMRRPSAWPFIFPQRKHFPVLCTSYYLLFWLQARLRGAAGALKLKTKTIHFIDLAQNKCSYCVLEVRRPHSSNLPFKTGGNTNIRAETFGSVSTTTTRPCYAFYSQQYQKPYVESLSISVISN